VYSSNLGFPLLKLPAELRYQVLEEALATDVPLRLLWNRTGLQSVHAHHDASYGLLCANKQLHEECRRLLFNKTPFVLNISRFVMHEAVGRGIPETQMTPAEAVATWKSLRGFETIILVVEAKYDYDSVTAKNLRIILRAFFGSKAKKDPKKRVMIRLDIGDSYLYSKSSTRLLGVMQTWLPKSNQIWLKCESALVENILEGKGGRTETILEWKKIFERFSDRLDIDVEKDPELGIVTT